MSQVHFHIQELVGAVKPLDSIGIFGLPSMDKVPDKRAFHKVAATSQIVGAGFS